MSEYIPFKHQVAGHEGSLSDPTESLFIKPSTPQEIQFYTDINEQEHKLQDIEDGMKLTDWIPKFLGTLQNGVSSSLPQSYEVQEQLKGLTIDSKQMTEGATYLVMENLLHGFRKPCIIDIKLGSKLADSTVSEEKSKRLAKVSATTTSGSLSYRVCGMKIFNDKITIPESLSHTKNSIKVDDEGYTVFDKYYGRALTGSTIHDNFDLFFNANGLNEEQRQIVIRNTFTRLQLLYNCLLDKEIRIISGSLLLVFEADTKRWDEMENYDMIFRDDYAFEEEEEDDDDEEEHKIAPLSLLSLIDFAHSRMTPGKGYDENIIKGVENLMDLIEKLMI